MAYPNTPLDAFRLPPLPGSVFFFIWQFTIFTAMKVFWLTFKNKIREIFPDFKNWILISAAFWFSHIILRFLLLFRDNPYGMPFVSKPDWYIFHAICLDFMWIMNLLCVFLLGAFLFRILIKTKISRFCAGRVFYGITHSILLVFTLLDHEFQRFLGSHFSIGLLDTYKDTSSLAMLGDYVSNDLSVPYLQFFVLALIIPFSFFVLHLLKKLRFNAKKVLVGVFIFYAASYSFVYFIWTGNARMAKLRPVISIFINDLSSGNKNDALPTEEVVKIARDFRNLWSEVEGDTLWVFADDSSKNPLLRYPREELVSSLQEARHERPNFLVIFLESHRGLNVGFLNPEEKSPTPFLDSIAKNARIWERMHTSGLPTTGGVLSSHIGIPHHSKRAQATELAHISIPSFASVLKDSGYTAHYFSAADPAWDNLGVWMSKWYNAQHYSRDREDDSTFFEYSAKYILDSLSQHEPFLATLTTRSNHYPFNFATGMTDEEKSRPLTERIKVTMNYTDRGLARFIRALQNEKWYKNTYVIILADHGFPLGENGVSTMNGGAFSNATWIPFLIAGKDIQAIRDTNTTAQLDIAPTILELAGIAVPNVFMGHNLLRGYGSGLALGAYAKDMALGYNDFRLVQKYPSVGEEHWLFKESDTHQKFDLAKQEKSVVQKMQVILENAIKLSDYALEFGYEE